MTLFEEWDAKAYNPATQEEYDKFWNKYLEEEKNIYDELLTNKEKTVKTTVGQFGSRFMIPDFKVTGFLDGINSSLVKEIELDNLEAESEFEFEIDYEKLYYNMLEAKAPWLYELPAWDEILAEDTRREITKEYRVSRTVRVEKVGRNEPCPCGSGKKYKKCCGK